MSEKTEQPEYKADKQPLKRLNNPEIAEAGKEYRWQAGQSGNPSGRPPNKRYLSELAREWLQQQAPEQDYTNDELVVKALGEKAKKGDARAIELLHDWTEGKVTDTHKIEGSIPVTLIREPAEIEED